MPLKQSRLVLTSAIITVGTAHPTRKLKITWWKYVIFVGWAVPTFALEIFIYLQGIRPTQKVAFYTREKKFSNTNIFLLRKTQDFLLSILLLNYHIQRQTKALCKMEREHSHFLTK